MTSLMDNKFLGYLKKGNIPPLSTESLKYSLFYDYPLSFMTHIICLADVFFILKRELQVIRIFVPASLL